MCQAVLALLSDPAPDSPLNCDAGARARAVGGGVLGRGRRAGAARWALGRAPPRACCLPPSAVCDAAARGRARSVPFALCAPRAGNLLRGGDVRGYNSLAKMYTMDHAMQHAPQQQR